tara:strand:+ start:648 stop:1241 length:594 start_codon:yes stop_codon:yes gene_type:complete
MLKIGLTGGIGSGKSAVSICFKKLGAFIFDADTVAKNILNNNKTAQSEIISEFGTDVIDINGNIDKKKLSRIAFRDDNNQLKLNTIIHPYVFTEIDLSFQSIFKKQNHEIFIVDAALIYESGADAHMDYVIVVTSNLKLRTERVMNRGNISREDFLKRVDLQWPENDKVEMADYIIHNNGTKKELENEAKKVYSQFS